MMRGSSSTPRIDSDRWPRLFAGACLAYAYSFNETDAR